jgi:hypothetical protein
MTIPGKVTVDPQSVQISSSQNSEKSGPSSSGVLQDGDAVDFRVLESMPGNRYRILVRGEHLSVHSRVPLEEGGRYLAEVKVRQGVIQFLSRPVAANAVEALLAQRQTLMTPLAPLLRTLFSSASLPPGFATDCRTGEAVRAAFLNCGLFYEARVREALRKRAPRTLGEDLKCFLLGQTGKHPVASVRETISAALKQLEVQQLLSLQGGPEGPFAFWLPFGEETIIEGFLKRFQRPRGTEFLVTFRVPFVPSEELLVTLVWNARRLEVHFFTGPVAYTTLRKVAHRLEERLADLGLPRSSVQVSRGVPKRLRSDLEGVRFVESYG